MNKRNRLLLVYFVCFPLRAAIAYLAGRYGQGSDLGKYGFGALGVVIGLGLLSFAIKRFLRPNTPQTGFSGGEVYWSSLVHSLFWISFGVLNLVGYDQAFILLWVDLIVGIMTTSSHYLIVG